MCLLKEQTRQKRGNNPFGPGKTQRILSNQNHRFHNYLDPNTRTMDFDRWFADQQARRQERKSNSGLGKMVENAVKQTQQPTNNAPSLFSGQNRGTNYGSIYRNSQNIYK